MGYDKVYLDHAVEFGRPTPEDWDDEVWAAHDGDAHDRAKAWEEEREARRENLLRPGCKSEVLQDEKRARFLNLIKKMVVTNPKERMAMPEVLTDYFLIPELKEEEDEDA
ncbi:hypothetical protein QQS21_006494 [Conoideocrella luteorostrata]|uniref:Protein kinase domain-containing protein n=1 Tax=Conoideocrella luteorostrata TaxID=1105319 RepID=A0AAJ0CMH4_9HYPO|nr:hypothetical protein QQS21_006494 [Conoideocrella luteorostrata]